MEPEDKRGKLTLSIDREVIQAARGAFKGEVSAMVERFLARAIKRKDRKK